MLLYCHRLTQSLHDQRHKKGIKQYSIRRRLTFASLHRWATAPLLIAAPLLPLFVKFKSGTTVPFTE